VFVGGALAVAALLGLGRGLPALLAHQKDRLASATNASQQARRAQASVAAQSVNERALGIVRGRLATYDSALLAGADPTAASARLSTLITDAAESTDTQVGGVQLQADSAATTMLGHVRARTTVTGDLESIALFMEALEAGPELLAIRELNITQASQLAVPRQRESLRAEILVEGLFLDPASRELRRR
jgi:hypothetical protein